MLRGLVQYILVAIVALIAYIYLNEFFVYIGEPVYVDTKYGSLKGRSQTIRGGRKVYSFTSIPYAKPPVRFEPPVPLEKWEDEVLDATKQIKVCMQWDTLWKRLDGVEDCLQLHVYTPNVDKSKPLLPVMVWFHGGHFMYGGNNIYGPDYLLEEDVVLVTVNYRLNALGFLNTGDDVVTGNQGMKDQVLALQWIQKTIKDFGGDPNSVTLFGNSAGGASVNYHMISPMSKGLFHRGISQSGSSLCPWGFTKNPKAQAKRLAGQLNCLPAASKSSLELVNCLKQKTAEEIVSVHKEIANIFHEADAIFGPSIEQVDEKTKAKGTVFLPNSPTKLYKSGQFNHVPWIAGLNSEEGCFRSPLVLTYEDRLSEINENWSQVAPNAFLLSNEDSSLSEKVREYYFGSAAAATGKSKKEPVGGNKVKSSKIGIKDLESMTNLYSDRYFNGCVRDAAVFHAQYAPVHMYYFTYKQNVNYGYILENTPGYAPVDIELVFGYAKLMLYRHVLKWEVNDFGVCHTDELQSLFNLNPLLTIKQNSQRYPFSREMVKLWASFSKNGKPDDFSGVTWDPLKFDKKTNKTVTPLQYLQIGNEPAMIDEPFTKRLNFWNELNLPKN
ncbi:unnamed protein product [Orchesella dallaii]|uniref:Carboxylic ester hydrolase n=1 Tax=Orchesella dallaii TaxID=48710 RepID=A0ABP1PX39_9HEXA